MSDEKDTPTPAASNGSPKGNRAIILSIALMCAALMVFLANTVFKDPTPPPVDYLKIVRIVNNEPSSVKRMLVVKQDSVRLDFRNEDREDLYALYPDERSLNQLVQEARRGGVEVNVAAPPGISLIKELLIQILPLVLFIGLLFYIMTRTGGMGKMFGGGKRFEPTETDSLTTFDDVAGLGEARAEVQEIVEFLEEPERFAKLGAKVPRGVLFVGPPGTGKTLMAKAVAGESGASFYSLTGSDFVEVFAGLAASRVRKLFSSARENAPAIIFIDEIDALGKARSGGSGLGGNEEREQALNQILSEMDGFDPSEAIVVIGATNRVDVLDAALLRPGRFDRQIAVELPDQAGRREILSVHAQGKPIDSTFLDRVAAQTPGFSGADLANLLNEAAIIAARRHQDIIDEDCLNEALLRVIAGLKRPGLMDENDKVKVAYHEVGHALAARFADHPMPVQKISVVSRGRALGFTLSIPEQDRLLETRSSLTSQLVMLLGGRAAEIVIYGEASSGASNDLERATRIAQQMVTRFGMSEKIGPRVVPQHEGAYTVEAGVSPLACSPQTAALVDDEVRAIIEDAQARAITIMTEKRDLLEKVTVRVREIETMERDEFYELIDDPENEKDASA